MKHAYQLCSQNPELKHMAVDVSAQNHFILDYGQLHAKKPLKVEFTNAEHELARNELQRLGVDHDKPFVCFMGRDNTYIENTGLSNVALHECRNMDISTFIPAMRWFASQGIYCLRVGSDVSRPIIENNPFIIDCSRHVIDRILDFYIPGNCVMNISVLSGPIEISYLRNIPTLIVNQFTYKSLTGSYVPYVHIIFKKFYSLLKKQYLSFDYVMKNNLNEQCPMKIFENNGLKIEDNTSDEILEASIETWNRIKGKFPSKIMKDKDEIIQCKYRRIAAKYAYNPNHTSIKSFIPLSFVERNQFFLEE